MSHELKTVLKLACFISALSFSAEFKLMDACIEWKLPDNIVITLY